MKLCTHGLRSAALLWIVVQTIAAQTPGTGALSGTVADPSGGAIAHAHVAVTSDATHQTRTTETNALGSFRLPLLAPGSYTVAVSAAGFVSSLTTEVQVSVGEAQVTDARSGSRR